VSLTGAINARLEAVRLPESAVEARCPHLIFHNVLGAEYVESLLNYVAVRQDDFQPGFTQNRQTGERYVDPNFRDCLSLRDLGAFEAPIKSFVASVAAPALKALHLNELAVEPKEFDISAYGDGGHFDEHIDTFERVERVRVLSCVYYFAKTPRRFSGGELRLYGFPKPSAAGNEPPRHSFFDIEPHTDMLIVFPSWLRHKVLTVRVPSGAWADWRFSVNCMVHRVGAPVGL
jgi:SM-20-related protein